MYLQALHLTHMPSGRMCFIDTPETNAMLKSMTVTQSGDRDMHIELTDREERIIESKIKAGRYTSPSQVVRAAIDLMGITPTSIKELQAMVEESVASLDRGEGVEWNARDFIARMHKEHPELA